MKDIFLKKKFFDFIKNDKIFLNKFFDLNTCILNTYGLGSFFFKFFQFRFETKNKIFNTLKKKLIFLRVFRTYLSRNYFSFFKLFEKNLVNLYYINTYRAWRHIRGLPVRGQRTWTNANSVYYSNVYLRKFIFKKASIDYSGVNSNSANIALLAEYANIT